MKHTITTLITETLLVTICNIGMADHELLLPGVGQKFESPGGEYVVSIEKKIPGEQEFVIKDKKTGQVSGTWSSPAKVFGLYWTDDSRTLVQVVESQNGPEAHLLFRNNNGKWVNFKVTPPSLANLQKAEVCDCTPLHSKVRLRYAIFTEYAIDNGVAKYYDCTMEVDPATGAFSSLDFKPVRHQEYKLMRSKYSTFESR